MYGASVCSIGKTSTATCTSGSKFISGGYNLTSWYGSEGRNAPDSAYPTTTGFVVVPPGSLKPARFHVAPPSDGALSNLKRVSGIYLIAKIYHL